jgi:hypothetical protein
VFLDDSMMRHPLYLAGMSLFMGMRVLLGSFVRVGWTIVVSILFAIKAVKEECTLADELEGYGVINLRAPHFPHNVQRLLKSLVLPKVVAYFILADHLHLHLSNIL